MGKEGAIQKHRQMVSQPKMRQPQSRIQDGARLRDGRAGPRERVPTRSRTKIPSRGGQWYGGVVPAGSDFHVKSKVAKCKAIILLHKYALLLRGDLKKKKKECRGEACPWYMFL